MKTVGVLIIGLILVFAFTGFQVVRADQADEDYKTGLKYYKGQGVTQDYTEALKWFQKAAEQNHPMAQKYIGGMFYSGDGVAQNFGEALDWFRKAAEQGDAQAQHNLGAMYLNGRGVTKDYAEAIKWFKKAAQQGNVNAQVYLGSSYNLGIGVTRDYTEATKWFRKAAEQGDSIAQAALGLAYYHGTGVVQDYKEALKWFRLAADQGLAQAELYIGQMYDNGKGVTQDRTAAKKWYLKAANQGEKSAKDRLKTFAQEVPEDQLEFVRLVLAARDSYSAASNDLLKGRERVLRKKAICKHLRDLQVNGWVGKISTLSSTSDGQKGVLAISIAKNITIKTWNNTLSDIGDGSLIPVDSPLFEVLSSLKIGNTVEFSGKFYSSDADCIKEISLTQSGAMTDSEFLFLFSTVSPR